ncbi:MAG: helix-turn-helix domain-containing protein [Streptosporangiales bacterium]|nr:helix-turn-helix domain-containing protein [Streptosporangiales bacterium]
MPSNSQPGDLGRRVAFRRRTLGLTREQVAARTGMAPGYVEYLEQSHTQKSIEALLRLAIALETTVDVLLGAAVERPPGGERGRRDGPVFADLEPRECLDLLARGGVGRVVFVTEEGPEALPVNFVLDEGTVVFRTSAEGVLARQVGQDVAFEVDRLDEPLAQGWSVLVAGRAEPVSDADERARIRVRPWADGERSYHVRIRPTRITGRRISTQGQLG